MGADEFDLREAEVQVDRQRMEWPTGRFLIRALEWTPDRNPSTWMVLA
jgi:hypothetical protein